MIQFMLLTLFKQCMSYISVTTLQENKINSAISDDLNLVNSVVEVLLDDEISLHFLEFLKKIENFKEESHIRSDYKTEFTKKNEEKIKQLLNTDPSTIKYHMKPFSYIFNRKGSEISLLAAMLFIEKISKTKPECIEKDDASENELTQIFSFSRKNTTIKRPTIISRTYIFKISDENSSDYKNCQEYEKFAISIDNTIKVIWFYCGEEFSNILKECNCSSEHSDNTSL